MKSFYNSIYNRTSFFIRGSSVIVTLIFFNACKDFVEIGPPQTGLIISSVFTSDATATAAMLDIYANMSRSGFACGGPQSVSFLTALSADEMIDETPGGTQTLQFNQNVISPVNTFLAVLWTDPYTYIYKANSIIEGLASSNGLSTPIKNQLEGEARFIRAFCHFYLVNLFGDIPLVISTDYQVNANIGRSAQADVYKQIIVDLVQAQTLLMDDYSFSNNQRTRINKGTASALLARTYLYTNDWSNAEIQASGIIADTANYSLVSDLTQTFLSTSHEAIWQFEQVSYPPELFTFYIFSTPPSAGVLRKDFVTGFEAGDLRSMVWIGNITDGEDTLFFPKKYQSFVQQAEYSTMFRVAEQYLIRAEARAKLNNVDGALNDLNTVRQRAGLSSSTASDVNTLLTAIYHERKYELFTEWGHRWLDLKRTLTADAVIAPLKPQWTPTAKLYPIPETQLLSDPAMKNEQNPGY